MPSSLPVIQQTKVQKEHHFIFQHWFVITIPSQVMHVTFPFVSAPSHHTKKPPPQVVLFEEATDTPIANLSPAARDYLATLGITHPDADAETAGLIWMHALAIGYSP
ncbi:MAG: hypothetical protein O7E52_17815, partial [Candidatus Poribacteria bacterium]|nr:hypothetical protein [Candidatus Poribacteria bacterium]